MGQKNSLKRNKPKNHTHGLSCPATMQGSAPQAVPRKISPEEENGNREGHLSRDQCFVGSHLGLGLYIASTMNPRWNWEYDLKVGGFVTESNLKNLCKCRQNMMKSNHFSSMFCFFVSEIFHKQSFFKHNLTLGGLSYICSLESGFEGWKYL